MLYFLLLVWCFLGVAIIANIFMEAIEVITSKRIRVTRDGVSTSVVLWNPTVANLTLLALGSSAPEIFLAVLEVLFGNFIAGELGPGTIVGSASFNLLLIIGICCMAIPRGETRRIEQFGVFIFTAVFSLWAYCWMYIVVNVISPDVIEIWEAALTIGFFGVLVSFAYIVDTGRIGRCCALARIGCYGLGRRVRAGGSTSGRLALRYLGRASSRLGELRSGDKLPRALSLSGHSLSGTLDPSDARKVLMAVSSSQHSHQSNTSGRGSNASGRGGGGGGGASSGPGSALDTDEAGELNKEELKALGQALRPITRGEQRELEMGGLARHRAALAAKTGKELPTRLNKGDVDEVRRMMGERTLSGHIGDFLAPVGADADAVRFECRSYAVMREQKRVEIGVERVLGADVDESSGQATVSVAYTTRDGPRLLAAGRGAGAGMVSGELAGGVAGVHYESTRGVLNFAPGERRKVIRVPILPSPMRRQRGGGEGDVFFELALSPPALGERPTPNDEYRWDDARRCVVRVSDDDSFGEIRWAHTEVCIDQILVEQALAPSALGGASSAEPRGGGQQARLRLLREKGSKGNVSVHVLVQCGEHREGSTPARAHVDFEPATLAVDFLAGETEAEVLLPLPAQLELEGERRHFEAKLLAPGGGATLAGADAEQVALVWVGDTDDRRRYLAEAAAILNEELDSPPTSWCGQFRDALMLSGEARAPFSEHLLHFVSVPWKLAFAFCPPPHYGGGWPCFVVALLGIGAVTFVIEEAASIFGCVVHVHDMCTAITFVALGTSLPDTFASKSAAINDDTADASITNVTGSNCVNVFLGLGLPWLMASIYWNCKGYNELWWERNAGIGLSRTRLETIVERFPRGAFVVNGDGLGDNVFTFICVACPALCWLLYRRYHCGGELGGPIGHKRFTFVFFVVLWLIYVSVSCLVSVEKRPGC